jgi:predicted MFS family arabinose efflux permease
VCVGLGVVLISRIARMPRPDRSSAGGVDTVAPAATHPIREGLRWLGANPPVRTLVVIILVFNVTWAAPWGILVLYATRHLGLGAVGYGALTTAAALGGIVGIVSFGRLERHVSFARLMRICLSLEVLMHLSFALTTSGTRVVAFVLMFVFGAYAFVWGTISTTVRQRLVPLHLQGRIASVNAVGVFAGLVIGQLLGGLIAQTWGLTAPWWFAAAGSAITLAIVWRSISNIMAARQVVDAVAESDVPETDAPGGGDLDDQGHRAPRP